MNDVVVRLTAALQPEDIVLGGGNVQHIKDLPPLCRRGNNADAFSGGLRLWAGTQVMARRSDSVLAS